MQVSEGMTADELAEAYRFSQERTLKIARTDAHMMCIDPAMERHFYKHLKPTKMYRMAAEELISMILRKSPSQSPQLVGVHMRNFEGDCIDRAQSVLAAPFALPGARMCNTVLSLVREIMAAHGISENRAVIYIGSDGQRPDLEETFLEMKNGVVAFSSEYDVGKLFKPAIVLQPLCHLISKLFISQSGHDRVLKVNLVYWQWIKHILNTHQQLEIKWFRWKNGLERSFVASS
jgi:hypothetical protein